MKILVLIAVLGLAGCAHNERLSDQPAQAAIQVQNWIPIGTSLDDARHIMEKHHFNCSEKTNDNFGDLKFADFLYCEYQTADSHATPAAVNRWQVALVLNKGKVSDVLVTTGAAGPSSRQGD